jgi:hypothetical protein
MPDWHKQNLTHFASVKKMVDQALSLEGPHALDPVEAWRLRPVSEGIMQAYSDARTGDPEAINRLCRHLAAAYSSLTAGPSAKRFFTEEGVRLQQNVLGPLEMRLGKAKKAAQKRKSSVRPPPRLRPPFARSPRTGGHRSKSCSLPASALFGTTSSARSTRCWRRGSSRSRRSPTSHSPSKRCCAARSDRRRRLWPVSDRNRRLLARSDRNVQVPAFSGRPSPLRAASVRQVV